MKVNDIACGYGFTIFAVNDSKAHLYGTGLNKDGQIGMEIFKPWCRERSLVERFLLGKQPVKSLLFELY